MASSSYAARPLGLNEKMHEDLHIVVEELNALFEYFKAHARDNYADYLYKVHNGLQTAYEHWRYTNPRELLFILTRMNRIMRKYKIPETIMTHFGNIANLRGCNQEIHTMVVYPDVWNADEVRRRSKAKSDKETEEVRLAYLHEAMRQQQRAASAAAPAAAAAPAPAAAAAPAPAAAADPAAKFFRRHRSPSRGGKKKSHKKTGRKTYKRRH